MRNSLTAPLEPEEQLTHLLRHTVSLNWVDVPTTEAAHTRDGAIRAFDVSGFVMSVSGTWCWVTAGHICRDLNQRLQEGRRIESCRLFDGWANPSRQDGGVPFDLDRPIPHAYDESRGLDYGVEILSDYYTRLLEANGVIPLDESKWKRPPTSVQIYEMVGIPSETTSHEVHEIAGVARVTSFLQPCSVPIKRESAPPKDALREHPRFYGTLIDRTEDGGPNGEVLRDIDGLSGSPIFGLRQNTHGSRDYWVVAIQSGWFRDRRLICGCPTVVLGTWIEEFLKERRRGVAR